MFFDKPTRPGSGRRRTDRRGAERLDLTVLSQTEGYWRSLLGKQQAPRRSDVDPSALGAALPNIMILERIAPGMARVRLAGQMLNQIFGMDVRGMPVSILVNQDSRKALGAQLEAAFSGPAVVEVPLLLQRGWGRAPMTARLLLLPLTDAYGSVNRALAVLAFEDAANPPRNIRFDVQTGGAFRCTLLPRVAAAEPPVVGADRRRPAPRPVEQPTLQELLPMRPAMPLFGIIQGGSSMKKSERPGAAPAKPSEPRPALRLVVSNDG